MKIKLNNICWVDKHGNDIDYNDMNLNGLPGSFVIRMVRQVVILGGFGILGNADFEAGIFRLNRAPGLDEHTAVLPVRQEILLRHADLPKQVVMLIEILPGKDRPPIPEGKAAGGGGKRHRRIGGCGAAQEKRRGCCQE